MAFSNGGNVVVRVNRSSTTRLTEVQAKILADWWGGSYRRIMGTEKSGEVLHGVVFRPHNPEEFALPPELAVFSLEEARALENVRDAVNPGSPDWLG